MTLGPTALDGDAVALLRLIRTPTIGPVTLLALLARFGNAVAAIEAVPDLARRGGGRAPIIPPIAAIERETERVDRLGARYLFRGRPGYPRLLAEIEDAPPVLIVGGDSGLLDRPTIAIVGARNASAAAIRFARGIAHGLGEAGVTVASGLARGIDTAAHAGSLEGGTVAVVAGGFDIHYPPENEALQRDIAARGLLIAEQPPGTEPRARHFPYRNRIISGVAQATLVVEAAPKSGSLITARLAAEQGREVMAVPGSPLDPRAQGCNQLIRDGATLVQSVADILEGLRPLAAGVAAVREGFTPSAPPSDADDVERATVLALLSPSPSPVDEIVRLSACAPAVVQTVLLELELAGRLDRHAGGKVSLAN